ncbi:E3 ubiquitin-protein ligase RMA3-like isoform X2 [Durio zibethinus]|nr:E3 ubiquitin-protein ligase RMA3-like isoform X2 [Durio zibethinus]
MGNSGNVSTLQSGEGSVAAEERTTDVPKSFETTNGFLEDEVSEKRDDIEKGLSNDGSFFYCNICLDLAREPVVTCCGHLFCWSCLYRLHVNSDAKECPVCKGEVTVKTLTPIYGRGNISHKPEEDAGLKIPPRPAGQRVDSWRQTIQRTSLNLSVEEMIRRLGSRFDLTRDLTPPVEANGTRETTERTNSVLNRILMSAGLHGEQNTVASLDDVDLTPSSVTGTDVVSSRIHSFYLQQRQLHLRRAARLTSLSSALRSAERLVETYFPSNPVGRNQEQPPPIDDRDSFSSIGAVINSESQMDTAAEIDSVVSLSASSSGRRNDASRVLDVDSGDSRAHRRRRLN